MLRTEAIGHQWARNLAYLFELPVKVLRALSTLEARYAIRPNLCCRSHCRRQRECIRKWTPESQPGRLVPLAALGVTRS